MNFESEARKIIDAQLSKAGWEADTENLLISNGVRPESGRNPAIAEWKTKTDYADYALFIGNKPYHQYVTELTYILFLKMASEVPGAEEKIPADCRWNKLAEKSGITLKNFYDELLKNLGKDGNGIVSQIYRDAISNIKAPGNLEKIITDIDALDWFSAREEGWAICMKACLKKTLTRKNPAPVSTSRRAS